MKFLVCILSKQNLCGWIDLFHQAMAFVRDARDLLITKCWAQRSNCWSVFPKMVPNSNKNVEQIRKLWPSRWIIWGLPFKTIWILNSLGTVLGSVLYALAGLCLGAARRLHVGLCFGCCFVGVAGWDLNGHYWLHEAAWLSGLGFKSSFHLFRDGQKNMVTVKYALLRPDCWTPTSKNQVAISSCKYLPRKRIFSHQEVSQRVKCHSISSILYNLEFGATIH